MDKQVVASLFQQGGQLLTEFIRAGFFRRAKLEQAQTLTLESQDLAESEKTTATQETTEGKASSIATGCVPCAIGHYSVCTGVLNESMRFARDKGMASNEVIDRIAHCLHELNALEREDLTSENIITLPKWEKDLAIEALNASRKTRHILEGATTIDALEQAVATTTTTNKQITRSWFKQRMANMPKEEEEILVKRAIDKLGERTNG